MITNLEITNFRSIQKGNIKLEPLTVIIGANSTGKSNLIKALDFISDITENGITEAIYKRGGFREILPKQFKDLAGREIVFKINITLDTPINWPSKYGELTGVYELGIKQERTGRVRITTESLEMNSFLLYSYYQEKKMNKKDSTLKNESDLPNIDELKNSYFTILRNKKGVLSFNSNVELNIENSNLLLNWLGINRMFEVRKENKLLTARELRKVIDSLLNNIRPGLKNDEVPIISLNRAVFNFCPHMRRLSTGLETISRYDLFINELRQEQLISNTDIVSVSGDNIPSVVKRFIKEEKESWQRISTTMSNISPYFSKVHSASLRAGKEYLIFEEIFKGRLVESWEASDGTLRALAILLCLESHSKGSTILIEEPEHGLHPWAVKDLMTHIKETIEIKNLQVILTTHSPQVLECINQQELLITERDENGTTYSQVNTIIPDPDISMGEIGGLWTSGLLRGVPTSI